MSRQKYRLTKRQKGKVLGTYIREKVRKQVREKELKRERVKDRKSLREKELM
jgi:hypothetical protein